MARALSLQVKVTLAIVLSLLIIDGVGAAIAEYNFRASEESHARDDSQTHVTALGNELDLRFHQLGQAASDAADMVGDRPAKEVQSALVRAGFVADVVVGGPNQTLLWTDGAAQSNQTLRALLESLLPDPQLPGRAFMMRDGWLVVSVRESGTSIVGAIDQQTLESSFLNDVLIDAEAANVIVTPDGTLVAASENFNDTSPAQLRQLASDNVDSLASLGGGHYIVERQALSGDGVPGYIAQLTPSSVIEARVDALVYRFVATSTAAVVLAGLATVFIVAYAMRPLRRITDAARRLGRGEVALGLEVRSRDEMGILADVLNQSAKAIGDARHAQEEHADELRLAAEDFQVAVGALARSVGEADTGPEVARRLADAALLVAPSRAVAVFLARELLEIRIRHPDPGEEPLDETAVRAMIASDADAFRWFTMRSEEEDLRLAIMPPAREELREGDGRKVEILLNQAALALHRARSMDSLRRAHGELDELLRQKQVYMDILSHDLKNPLAVARGRVEMIARKHPDLAERFAPIEQSLDRATRIIEEAVLYSKLEGKGELERPETDLAGLAQDAVHGLAPLAAQRSIDLVCVAPARVPWRVNHILARAVENLVSNAIKWSPERGQVAVEVEPEAERCRIRIVDHGPGIPVEDRARLFGRFERADRSGVKGTGLGLAIAKRVVDMHGGAIRIEDTPGGGCTFVIELPRGASPAPSAPPAAAPGPASPDTPSTAAPAGGGPP
jgi:signal transduction histidine kinase